MKILQISNYYAPAIGGIEQVAHDCSDALKNENAVRVVCFNHEKGNRTDEIDGVKVVRTGCFAKVASQSMSFSFNKLLKRTFREFQPDVVIFHYPNPFLAHYLLKCLKKHRGCKLVVYWHLDITKQKILGKFFKGQNKRLCKRADRVIGATPVHLNESNYASYFQGKTCIVPYCIADSSFVMNSEDCDAAEKIRSENKDKIICFAMGRHVPYKGLTYLIKASKLLDDRFRIFIAGSGPLSEKLKKEAQDDAKIKFLGKIDVRMRKAYLSSCDIFCFPSITRNENFGLALAEAMRFSKPSVTFTIPHSGVNYVNLNGVTGIEVENCNVEQYAEAMRTLADDKELRERYGQAAKERVNENFTQQILKKNMIKVLEELQ